MIHTLMLAGALATTPTPSTDEMCFSLAELGVTIIEVHEAGAPIEPILRRIDQDDEPFRTIFRNMVLKVYSKPPTGAKIDKVQLKNRIIVNCVTEADNDSTVPFTR